MKRFLAAIVLFTWCIQNCFAQQADTAAVKKTRTDDCYIGVQINGLINEVFGGSTNSSIVNQNPYLFTFSEISKETGWGFRAGLGLQAGTSTNANSTSKINFTPDSTFKIFELHLRVGVEKSFKVYNKIFGGVGMDLVYNDIKNDLKLSYTGFTPGTTGEEVKTTGSSYGGGPVASLRYQFTDRIALGTEASFYYVTGDEKITVVSVGDNGKQTISAGTFNLPIAFYFIVRF